MRDLSAINKMSKNIFEFNNGKRNIKEINIGGQSTKRFIMNIKTRIKKENPNKEFFNSIIEGIIEIPVTEETKDKPKRLEFCQFMDKIKEAISVFLIMLNIAK